MQTERLIPFAVAMALMAGPVIAQDFFQTQNPNLSEERRIRNTWIVELSGSPDIEDLRGRAREIAETFGGRIEYVYGTAYNGFSVEMAEIGIARMLQARGLGVVSVTRNDVVTLSGRECKGPRANDPGCPGTGPEEPVDPVCELPEMPWGIARVTPIAPNEACDGFEQDFATLNRYATSGLNVCVLDTGVDESHPDLNVTANLASNNFTSYAHNDVQGHGTHVAGTIGATANGFGVIGVAPDVSITSIKVLGDNGSGSYSGVIAGIDRAAALQQAGQGCDVANMSLGGGRSSAVDNAVRGAVLQGVVFALAAGNDGQDTEGYSPAAASDDRTTDGVYTIAAFAKGDTWASFSNYDANGAAPIVDFAMPGVGVKSTLPGNRYGTYNGTSMAAPHMAGLIIRYMADYNMTGPIKNVDFDKVGQVLRGDGGGGGGRGKKKSTATGETYVIAGDDGRP